MIFKWLRERKEKKEAKAFDKAMASIERRQSRVQPGDSAEAISPGDALLWEQKLKRIKMGLDPITGLPRELP